MIVNLKVKEEVRAAIETDKNLENERIEITSITFDKFNVCIDLKNTNVASVTKLCDDLGKKCRKNNIYISCGYLKPPNDLSFDKNAPMFLSIGFSKVEKFEAFLIALSGCKLFHTNTVLDGMMIKIFGYVYLDYCILTKNKFPDQKMHYGVFKNDNLTMWNPMQQPKGSVYVLDSILIEHKKHLEELWEICSKPDECVGYPFRGMCIRCNIDLIPSENAKNKALAMKKDILEINIPGTKWQLKYNYMIETNGSLHCSIECEKSEREKILKKIEDFRNSVAFDFNKLKNNTKSYSLAETTKKDKIKITLTDFLDLSARIISLEQCYCCQRQIPKYYKCPCYKAYYCGVECQKKDWPKHKLICTYVKPKP